MIEYVTEDIGQTDDTAMHMTAYARLEQFRTDIEKLLAEKATSDMQDNYTPQSDQPDITAPEDRPGGTAQDAAIEMAGKNLFKAVDDALAVLN